MTYTAGALIRNKMVYSAEYNSREMAVAALFAAYPKLKSCSSGYGYHGSFNILFHKREG
jgi:hypothetical protein